MPAGKAAWTPQLTEHCTALPALIPGYLINSMGELGMEYIDATAQYPMVLLEHLGTCAVFVPALFDGPFEAQIGTIYLVKEMGLVAGYLLAF